MVPIRSHADLCHMQKLALQMRAQGKAYRRPPEKKQATEEAKAKAGRPGHQPASQAGKEETGSQPDHPVEVNLL